MAATTASIAMLNTKCFLSISSPNHLNPSKPSLFKPISLLSLHNLPKGLTTSKVTTTDNNPNLSPSLSATAIAGAIFSTLSSSDPAIAAQQIAEIAESDNRGLALLLPIIPAIAWVLFNILQPALNQINKMRSTKGIIVGLALGGGLAASTFLSIPSASASEVAMIADASNDNRGSLLLFVVGPAILWVLYNILQPALNQINRMRS
ncbi:photosystem II core complex proteins psbY, chloroplastic-like [Macadamia integrifolia]|uniref:photosystem II core complex proteins psbY, chloroplastic-like n=1 Tax=Macadamia integrifolia TaxID=60698 RepID=UPI001C4E7F5B|nr:photosystem II core complex proteins psbY, chloroplastic-like [Macadamia integrifolia]